MKRSIVIGMALAFALGVAGFGYGADKEMVAMKHDDAKVCGNVDCCGNQAKTTLKDSESKKTDDQQLEKVYEIRPSDG